MSQEAILKLKEMVANSDNIVFFGGAGVSTESGIPDFRSVDGLYHQQYDYPPETILSHTFYVRKPVITQNIDGLHQAAGSKNVLELHGSIHRCYCMQCGRVHDPDEMNLGKGVPRCSCGGIIRPDIVLYEEALDQDVLAKSVHYIRNADILIVGGTSLAVYPAAGLLNYYRGDKLVLVNRSATPYDSAANLIIHEKIGDVFSQI